MDNVNIETKTKADLLADRITAELKKGSVSEAQVLFWIKKLIHKQDDVFLYNEYPDLEVKFEDLIEMKDELSFKDTIASIIKKQEENNMPNPTIVQPTVEETIQPQVEISKVEAPATPDMLTGTGYTMVMDPVDANAPAPEVPATNEPVKQPVESIERAPMKKTKKPVSFKSGNSQGGFAEVIVLGVVVLVYIAIIVNLIIRLN